MSRHCVDRCLGTKQVGGKIPSRANKGPTDELDLEMTSDLKSQTTPELTHHFIVDGANIPWKVKKKGATVNPGKPHPQEQMQ